MTHKPSYAPVLMAFGLMGLLWGAVTTWLISAVGLVVVGIASIRWLRDAHPDAEATPLQPEREPERLARATVKPEAARRSESRMASPWLHRYAILLAICMFALVIAGALITSNPTPTPVLRNTHIAIAVTVGLLTLGLAFWLRGPAWILLAAILVEAALGGRSPAVGAFHALLAQLTFAGAVAIAWITSSRRRTSPEPLPDSPRVSLRTLSLVTLALLVLQVALGAAYRHKAMGVMPHIIGALIVTLALLLLAILVTNQYPEHRGLRPPAKILIGVTFAQVMLGMAAFITRLMMAEGTLPMVVVSVAHVANGALTLAATTLLMLQIRRYIRPA